jgi:hypothetical protein
MKAKCLLTKHIDYIIFKASQKLGFLKTISSKINGETFLSFYKSYILSLLEYSKLCVIPNKSQ